MGGRSLGAGGGLPQLSHLSVRTATLLCGRDLCSGRVREVLTLCAAGPAHIPGLRGWPCPPGPTLGLCLLPTPQNIRVWDMQDYICLQSFCGKLFALGNCPITSAYFHENEDSLVCTTYSVSAARGGRPGAETTLIRPHPSLKEPMI